MKDHNLGIIRVLSILLRALDYIDVRLVDHGQRVAYMVYKMMQVDGTLDEHEMKEICIVAALHDIGAYKTEEIDHMMDFEINQVFDHSIYGYLFLKYLSPLSKWADLVLYHHTNYRDHEKILFEHLNISDMFHLADRMDILLQSTGKLPTAKELYAQADSRFGKDTIRIFLEANRRYDLSGSIMDGQYLTELANFVSDASFHEDTLLDFFKMVGFSIDFRSETTVSHVISTVCISTALAELLEVDDDEKKSIQLGAYLHDIGKISTPLEILEKKGGLSEAEMTIMRSHIEVTRQILEGRIHEDVLQIAYRHHEKMDGSGYPNRLKGNALSLPQRIVAVADVMSALSGKRSYKDSFPKSKIIDILFKQKVQGKLCGSVIDVALAHYDAIMEKNGIQALQNLNIYHKIRSEFNFIRNQWEGII